MTRFNLSTLDAVKFVILTLQKAKGGEIFVPKIPSYRIMDLANAFGKNIKKKIVGIRPGEKLHEELISSSESFNTFEYKDYYIVLPTSFNNKIYNIRYKFYKPKNKVKKNFSYTSKNNQKFLSQEKLKKIINLYLSK